jgi:ferredoxin-NADP reductase
MDETEVMVRAVTTVGPGTIALELETPADFDANPGQFVRLHATVDGEEIARYYTLSSPDIEETFEITVGIDPEGDLSPWLADRESGDTVTIEGPFGNVVYDEGDVAVLAGGPGVGPAVGVAEAAVAEGSEATIVYQDDAPAHEQRLDALVDSGATVRIVENKQGLTDAVREVVDDGQIYVFGFQAFVEDARDAVEAGGGDFSEAEVESFG